MHPLTQPLAAAAATPELFARYIVPNYGRFPMTIARGEGSCGVGGRKEHTVTSISPPASPSAHWGIAIPK